MKEFSRAAGIVRIRLPDAAEDVTDGDEAPRPRRGARGRAAGADPQQSEMDIMLDALSEEDSLADKPLQLVNRFATDVGDGTSSTTRRARGAPPEKQEMDIDLSLQQGESAVVLIEQDGSYEWHYPTNRKDVSGSRRGSGTRSQAASAVVSRVSFRIPIGESGRLPRGSRAGRAHRGPITGFIKGKIKGFILKFVARKAIGALTRRLERGVDEGPVIVNSATDATLWERRTQYPTDVLPADRAHRVLLLVHGTFSSTLGSFGALSAFSEGQAMLQQALSQYDLVIGYDHYTLSETPEQNAEAILAALLPLISEGQPLEIDAICFSRGGLVYRYLSEVLIPDAGVSIVCRKAIFVACTNGGTELASDENWKHLIDFYTNMIAGATRLIGLAPGAALPTRILRQGIKVVGSLVAYIAQDSIANNSVPGVAAMEPNGDFVLAMNQPPTHRHLPAVQSNYAIASNFEPSGNEDHFGMGKMLALKVADGFVDRLMDADNDLVVNNSSMFVIDPLPAARLLGSRQIEANGKIYHTVYFHQPMVASTCGQWLGILEPVVSLRGSATPVNAGLGVGVEVEVAATARNWWTDAVGEDFLRLTFTSTVGDARKQLKRTSARYVVLQRLHEGQMLYYGFEAESISSNLKYESDQHAPIGQVLGLHEWQTRTLQLDDALMADSPAQLRNIADDKAPDRGLSPGGPDLVVILDDDAPVGVVAHPPVMSASPFEADVARMQPSAPGPSPVIAASVAPPQSQARGAARGRGAPRSAPPAPSARSAPSAAPAPAPAASAEELASPEMQAGQPQTVWCNMHASMDEEVAVTRSAYLEVTLSRDLISRETGVSAGGEFQADKQLIIQALARKHCDIIGSDSCEMAIPAEGSEESVFFEIKALHAGAGEVDVFARQGNQPIIKLKLRPRFIPKKATPVPGITTATANLQPAAPRPQLPDVLYIYDVQVGQERILEFNIQSPQVRLQGRFRSKPFKSEDARLDYIANLYQEIEDFWARDQNDYDAFMQNLMARGANLFDTLVPVEIQQRLWDARKTLKGIQVISDEPFIPWELLYIKQPGKPARPDSTFLAEMGMLRWVSNIHFAPTEIRLRPGHFRHIVPSYPEASGYALPGAQAERKMLEKKFGAKAIVPSSKAVQKALSSPLANDILHFACHGLADSSSIWNSGLMMKGQMDGNDYRKDELSYEWTSMFAALNDEGSYGPLVFLNACQTGRQGYNLTSTGGFAQAFVKAGASAFIGSHWSVGDVPAVVFCQTFYEELIDNQAIMMDAVISARKAAKNSKEVTWLAYAVYADPFARIVRQ